jgi:predicted dehydrogenase
MSNTVSVRCLIVGHGKMGQAHLNAVIALEPDALAVWAPNKTFENFDFDCIQFFNKNLEEAVQIFRPTHAIIASPINTLIPISLQLIGLGVRHLLVEKPVTLNIREGAILTAAVKASGVSLYVGYNRRFYSSVRTALRLIADAGEEIESVFFEFNEAFPKSSVPSKYLSAVFERWVIANSMHVIDSALFPVGHPDPSSSVFYRSGGLIWHPAGSIFVGAGTTSLGKPFTYHANWETPGRWGFQWMTSSARYVFQPLEKLAVMRRGNFILEDVPLKDELDQLFKPGVYLQNRAFLFGGDQASELVSLEYALSLICLGKRIAGYSEVEDDTQV